MARSLMPSSLRRIIGLLLAALLLGTVWMPSASYAGKEGVFLTDSVYFTIEEASLFSVTGNSTLAFTLRLNNGGSSEIDYNRFSVRVTSEQGGSYSTELSQAGNGFVKPGSGDNYSYFAKVPSSAKAEDLYVTISEWSTASNTRKDIGSLSVGKVEGLNRGGSQLMVNLADVSDTGKNVYVSVQAKSGYIVPENGKWTVALSLDVKNTGNDRVSLASAPTYALRSADGSSYAMAAAWPSGSELGARQSVPLVLSATMDVQPDVGGLRLEVLRSDGTAFAAIDAGTLFTAIQAGDKVPYTGQGGSGALTLEVGRASLVTKGDDLQVMASVLLKNEGAWTVKAPTLAGVFVSAQEQLELDAYAASASKAYLSAGETVVYRFAASIPDGVQAPSLQLVLADQLAVKSTNGTGAAGGNAATTMRVPVLTADLAGAFQLEQEEGSAPDYEWGSAFAFEPGTSMADSKLDISLVELSAHSHADNGYRTAVAKFKYVNNYSETVALPVFSTELVDANGVSYPGTKQNSAMQQLIPNTAYVVSYSYLLPPGTSSETLTLRILEDTGGQKLELPMASYRVAMKHVDGEDAHTQQRELSFYPFTVKIEDWTIQYLFNNGSYSYILNTSLEIQRAEQVMIDDQFSVMELELVDSSDRVLGTTTAVFTGTNKLVSGRHKLTFASIKSEQFTLPVTINIYEKMETPSGTVRRLVTVLKQS
jgi:hypothetical protein